MISGKYNWGEVHKSGIDKYRKYGDIVKETIVPGVDVIWLFDPNDIAKVLNNAGPDMYPQRKSHLGLEKYRKDRPHIYRTGGLLPTWVFFRIAKTFEIFSLVDHFVGMVSNGGTCDRNFKKDWVRRIIFVNFYPIRRA